MRKAKVLFDYEPQEDDELQLKVGDVITDVENADAGWCSGTLNGKRGMFPDNFVEITEEQEKKSPPLPPAGNKKPSKKKNLRRLKVTFAYTADSTDEISLDIGEIIEIVKDVEEGWAEGIKSNGKKGVFPTNFGEILEEEAEPEDSVDGGATTTQEESKPNDEASSAQKKVKGIGFGNIFGDGPIKLRQRSIGESDRKKNLSTPPTKPAVPAVEKEPTKDISPAKPKKTVSYCRVMFDYAKDNEDELGLMKGEIVVILSKSPGDEGWWEGEKEENGKRVKGVFPDNFVVELTPDEAKEHEKQQQGKSETPKETKTARPTSKEVKKVTPLMPAPPSQSAKPATNSDGTTNHATDPGFSESSLTDHTLSHVKRPAGPKNRRKPGAAERREKAAASQISVSNGEEESEEEAKPEPVPAPKKESVKRGVAVLPGLGGAGDAPSGETPSWLQNLKNRQSTKKPPPAVPSKEPAESPAAPAWLANLKKRQSSEFPEKTSPAPTKEKTALQPKIPAEKPKPANGQVTGPPAKPAAPRLVQKPTSPAEKPLAAWQLERQQKTKKTKSSEPNEEKAPEPPDQQPAAAAPPADAAPPPTWKNSLSRKAPSGVKSPTEPQAPVAIKKPDKPALGTPVTTPVSGVRTKPPPPKVKPAPAAKPASSTVVEELKTEMKNMKEEMEKIREDMKKEILRLNSELQSEKDHRISLEEEVRKLRKKVSL